ncbi:MULTISPECIES: flagellar hook-length control protein FliK [Sphingobium]|jgi:flagellar hook-length control protein FliK|uniref:Flagellar hook-length control protein FliK n=1 Tax=Sphingobium fuliginis (strain ATCC 27551) TaxID=336203 RepID=A0A7M2GEW3_SPHSA|nr:MULTISPECIES: flagellar hook-length control protein FliK [Sphingobium]QOT70767.1 flagellar hook-length control protein FliK [Sphingobium fuliginis]
MSDVNMLTSLKALLFSSAATSMPADGAAASAVPAEGAADFAKLLNGTMAALPEAQESAGIAGPPQGIAPAAADEAEGMEPAPPKAGKADGGDPEVETASPLPFGLANALRAVQSHRKDSLPLPPGLARKIDAPAEAAVRETAPAVDAGPMVDAGPAVDSGSVEEVAAEMPAAAPVAMEEGEVGGPELPVATPDPQTKAPRPGKETKPEKVEALPEAAAVEHADEPVEAEPGDSDRPKEQAEAAQAPATVVAAVQMPASPSVPAQALPPSTAPVAQTAPAKPDRGKNLPVAAPLPPQSAGQPVPAQSTVEPTPVADAPVQPAIEAPAASADQPEGPVPAAHPGSAPVKSEALALLQLVRDQVAARQPGTPVRAGEPLAARVETGRAATPVDAVPAHAVQHDPVDAVPPMPLAQPVSAQPVPSAVAPPPADLSASLGAQIVDMGVSGQWIDGLAREIAGLSANGAQGRFQINADQLGAVQVDIRQGSDGAAVSLTVASEAAEMALRQDSDRLRLDAGLSAVRIAEVKIERAPPVAEAARADSANQQQSSQQQGAQQQGSQGANAWANNGQNMAQSQGQGRWRPQENSAFAPKNSGDPAVLNHDELRHAGNPAARARYA